MKKTAEERFWEKVDKTGECWIWTASCGSHGYGQFKDGGTVVLAHRVSYALVNGDIPEGLQVDHRCHDRRCVRPEHLRPVTNAQNQQNRGGATKASATGVRGVSWHKATRKYRAQVNLNGKHFHVGVFDNLAEAEAAVIAKRRDLYTHDDYVDWAATTDGAAGFR